MNDPRRACNVERHLLDLTPCFAMRRAIILRKIEDLSIALLMEPLERAMDAHRPDRGALAELLVGVVAFAS